MRTGVWLVCGVGVGAMALVGSRAVYRDGGRGTGRIAGIPGRLFAGARDRLRRPMSREQRLEDRLRRRIRRVSSYPHGIEVIARQGYVELTGEVLAHDHARVVAAMRGARGVVVVEDHLEVQATPEQLRSLPHDRRGALVRRRRSPGRWIAVVSGLGLITAGVIRRGGLGAALAGAGAAAVAGGVLVRRRRRPGMIELRVRSRVAAPVDDVFAVWSNLEGFPLFVAGIEEVRRTAGDQYLWRARGPSGSAIDWEAEVTRYVPGELIVLRSAPGAPVESEIMVRFNGCGQQQTMVDVRVSYRPTERLDPRDAAAMTAARMRRRLKQDLQRFRGRIQRPVAA